MRALIVRIAPLLGLLLFLLPAALTSGGRSLAGEGKLEKIKEKVKDRDKDRDKGKRKKDKDSEGLFDDDDDEDDDAWDLEVLVDVLDFTLHVLALPFTLPAEAVNDDGDRLFRFEKYPYRRPGRAYVRVIPRKEKVKGPPAAEGVPPGWEGPARKRARRDEVDPDISFRPTYAFERHSSDLCAHRLEVLLRSNARYNLDLSFTDYAEDVAGGTDHMQHIKAHVTYSFAVSPRVLFAAGIGGRSLVWEDGATASGVDFRYEAEFFPRKPVHLHFITEAGWVEGQGAWEVEGRVGVAYKRLQLFLGYRHFSVAGEDLAGPTFGLTLWF